MASEQVSVDDGKYTIIFDSGKMTALRHGEPWNRDINGDKLIYAMFARIQQLEQDLTLAQAAPGASPQDPAAGSGGEAERLLQAIGDAAHRVGIYNGTAPLSGPLALMLLNDMVTQSGLGPREILSSAQEEARALGAELATATQHDDNDPEGHDISAGLLGPNVSAWLRKVAAERIKAKIHAESGKTVDELWMETGRLRARLADAKVRSQPSLEAGSASQTEPAHRALPNDVDDPLAFEEARIRALGDRIRSLPKTIDASTSFTVEKRETSILGLSGMRWFVVNSKGESSGVGYRTQAEADTDRLQRVVDNPERKALMEELEAAAVKLAEAKAQAGAKVSPLVESAPRTESPDTAPQSKSLAQARAHFMRPMVSRALPTDGHSVPAQPIASVNASLPAKQEEPPPSTGMRKLKR